MKILNNRMIECYLGVDEAEYSGIYLYENEPYIDSSSGIEFSTSDCCSELFDSNKNLLKLLNLEKGKCYKLRLTVIEDITKSLEVRE